MSSILTGWEEGSLLQKAVNKKKSQASITLKEKWCKSCGICVEFCPHGVLSEGKLARPEVRNIEKCNVCRLCELRCPEMAIIVTGGDAQDAK